MSDVEKITWTGSGCKARFSEWLHKFSVENCQGVDYVDYSKLVWGELWSYELSFIQERVFNEIFDFMSSYEEYPVAEWVDRLGGDSAFLWELACDREGVEGLSVDAYDWTIPEHSDAMYEYQDLLAVSVWDLHYQPALVDAVDDYWDLMARGLTE